MSAANRAPAAPEWHRWDASTGRCDRPECSEIFARCPAEGRGYAVDAGADRATNAHYAARGLAPSNHAPPKRAPQGALVLPPRGPSELTLQPAPVKTSRRRRRLSNVKAEGDPPMPTIVDEFYRPPRRVRIERAELVTAFALAYVELADARADTREAKNVVQLVSAQAGLELADDRTTKEDDESVLNYALTGHKRPTGGGVPWTVLGTHEVVKNSVADFYIKAGVADPEKFPHKAPVGYRAVYFHTRLGPELSHVATHFRAFDTLDEGARFSLGRYLVTGRYATEAVRRALRARDARAFAVALKSGGYFTAMTSEYAAGLAYQLTLVDAVDSRIDWAGMPIMSQARAKRLADQGALALWGSVRSGQADTLTEFERSRAKGEP